MDGHPVQIRGSRPRVLMELKSSCCPSKEGRVGVLKKKKNTCKIITCLLTAGLDWPHVCLSADRYGRAHSADSQQQPRAPPERTHLLHPAGTQRKGDDSRHGRCKLPFILKESEGSWRSHEINQQLCNLKERDVFSREQECKWQHKKPRGRFFGLSFFFLFF